MNSNIFNRILTLLLAIVLLVTPFSDAVLASKIDNDSLINSNEYIANDLDTGRTTRNSEEAKSVAEDFLEETEVSLRRGFIDFNSNELVQSYPVEEISFRSGFGMSEDSELYAFNRKSGGFVIVSGDKRSTDVLAYSKEGSFDFESSSPELKSFIGEYENQIRHIRNNPEEFANVLELKQQLNDGVEANVSAIYPFMEDIKWDQLDPYNLLAPEYRAGQRSAIGCVATAMAQVMKYYEYPSKGVKDASYDWRNPYTGEVENLSAKISEHEYDWKNMPKTYKGVTDEEQRNNVAQLMYDAAVSTKMNFGPTSTTSSIGAGIALVENFGYDRGLKDLYRAAYTNSDWHNIMKAELTAKRPVFYAGTGKDGGHQFILDGYDENNLYHVNWGWSGSANGYYALDALNPTFLGTGAAGGTYNMNQEALVGLKPSDENIVEQTSRAINTGKLFRYKDGKKIEVADLNKGPFTTDDEVIYSDWDLYVEGMDGYEGEHRLGIEVDGEIRFSATGRSTGVGRYTSTQTILWYNLQFVDNVFRGLDDGEYQFKIYREIKKLEGKSEFVEVNAAVGKPDVLRARKEGKSITYYLAEEDRANLELTYFESDPNWKLYEGSNGKFNIKIKNNGNKEYNSITYLQLKNKDDKKEYLIGDRQIEISAGQEREFLINDDLKVGKTNIPAGNYTATMIYNKGNTQEEDTSKAVYVPMGESIDILILAKSNGTIEYPSLPQFVDNTNPKIVSKPEDLSLVTKVQAEGGMVEGRFTVIGFVASVGGNDLQYSSEKFRLEDGESKEINIVYKEDLSNLIDGTQYGLVLRFNGVKVEPSLLFTYVAPEEVKVDKEDLDSAIADAEAKLQEEVKYTAETVQVLKNALVQAEIISAKVDATQEEVDSATTALKNAIGNLKEKDKPVDKTALQSKYDQIASREKDNYTDESWEIFETVRSNAKILLENPEATQEEVDQMLIDLESALFGLKEKTLDKTALQAKYDEVKGKVQGQYTNASWREFEIAREEAKTVLDEDDVKQNMVEETLEKLEVAIANLKLKQVDKSALNNAITEANEKLQKEDDYTAESVESLREVLAEAEIISAKVDVTQGEVDSATTALKNGIGDLKEKEKPVDKTALQSKYDQIANREKDNYTDESWGKFEVVRSNAKILLENPEATQKEVDQMLIDLESALFGLKEKTLDKTALQAKYDEVKDGVQGDYTDASWRAFEMARDEAKTVLDKDDVKQNMVEETLEKLEAAIANLKLKQVDKTELNNLISEAETKLQEEDKYTEETVQALEVALAKAKEVSSDDMASQEEVDKAAEKLKEAIEGLKIKDKPVDPEIKPDPEPESPSNGYNDNNYTEEYEISQPVEKDEVVSKENTDETIVEDTVKIEFLDIGNHWAERIIKYIVKEGYYNKLSIDKFEPNKLITRGEFITVLGEMAKVNPEQYQSSKANDLNKSDGYFPYANWALDNGIAKGFTDGSFRGDKTLTREEISVLLSNTLEYMNRKLNSEKIIVFIDENKISSWAKESVNKLVSSGYLKGKGKKTFSPKSNLTRAESAQIIYNTITK